jgi:hypothetical protein
MGRGSDNSFSNYKPVYAQTKGLKTGETARIDFTIKDPENEGEYLDDGHENGISGNLVAVMDKTYKHNGDEVPQACIVLEDPDEEETYFLSFGISMIGTNIINSIAGCNEIGKISISLWNDKETGYAKVFVKNNGEKTEWAYQWDELKDKVSYTKVKEKGKMVDKRDDWDLKQFMLKDVLMGEVAEKLPKQKKVEKPAAKEPEVQDAEYVDDVPPSSAAEGENVPF